MKIIIGAGGTGGHLYPALALVEYIKEQQPDTEFLFVGTKDRVEAHVVPQRGYKYIGLNVRGLVGNPLKKAVAVSIFLKSVFKARKIIKEFKPDIVIGFGGYPSASVVKAAGMLKIKTLIHEQNSTIGLTNKILINQVDAIVCCYQKAYEQLPKEKTYLLGNPRASEMSNLLISDSFEKYNLDKNKKLVVIVMGSLGSKTVNGVVEKAIGEFSKKDYSVLFVTGTKYYDEVITKNIKASNVKIIPYVDDMPSLLSNCDLIVSRAGASTIAEITSIGLPSLLIPSPYVAANHQEYNAKELVERNAASMILEKDLNVNDFVLKVDELLSNNVFTETMKKNAKELGKPEACKDMYDLIIKMLGVKR